MTIEEVKRLVQEIRENAHDYEVAHELEDTLHRKVLKAISTMSCATLGHGAALCREALKSRSIDFLRVCA